MAHDVFISYSSRDKSVANAVCATLENRKIRCWIAPRDVPAGLPYAAALVKAINQSKILVLILSEGSNTSGAVMREVEEAVDNGIPIIPFRIEEIEPTEAMRYYIKSIHWIDAMNPPLEKHLGKLADSVQAILSVEGDLPTSSQPEPVSVLPAKQRRRLPVWAAILLAFGGMGIIAGGIWFFSTKQGITSEDQGVESAYTENEADLDQSEWQTPTFFTPNPNIWEVEDNQYTAIKQHDSDAFAWSKETFEGDLTINLDLYSAEEAVDLDWNEMEKYFPGQDSGCVIVYGDGQGFSQGCLIFCVNWDGYYLEKDSKYTDEYPLAFVPIRPFIKTDQVYSVTIEISEDLAIMYVDGKEVLSSFFNPDEINRSGRIGLFRNWAEGEFTFSNIQVRTSAGPQE